MIQANNAILLVVRQIDDLLQQIDPHDYRRTLPEFDGSTLGQHFRHILEFFQCLQKGLGHGQIDYAARERNLLYEDNPLLAAAAFNDFIPLLESYIADKELEVKGEFGGAERPVYGSTLGRELLFVYDHAIHHLAMIKVGIRCHFPEIQLDRDLGVSPSTLKSRRAAAQVDLAIDRQTLRVTP